ncbi:dTDP-4-dehydrorhamnose 3,5-epimerase [soil metagenome]
MALREIAEIEGLLLIEPAKLGDERGFFSETFNAGRLAGLGFERAFVQDNHAYTAAAGTLRGLHYQAPPFAQDKLLRVVRGAILDVALDIRRGSPSFGDHAAVKLSAANWRQLLVPVGFAHGYLTLEPDTEVIYKVSADYAPDHDRGILWCDPALGIDWGIDAQAARLSGKDRAQPRFDPAATPFGFGAAAAGAMSSGAP